nr:hypothetical protein [Vibrio cholerae]
MVKVLCGKLVIALSAP